MFLQIFLASQLLRALSMQLCRGAPSGWSPMATHAWWWSVSALMNTEKHERERVSEGRDNLMKIVLHDNEFKWWHLCASVSQTHLYIEWVWQPLIESVRLNEDYSKASVFHLGGFGFDIIRWWTVENLTELVQFKRGQKAEFPTDLVKLGRWKWRGSTNHHLSYDAILKIYTYFGFLQLGTTDSLLTWMLTPPWA